MAARHDQGGDHQRRLNARLQIPGCRQRMDMQPIINRINMLGRQGVRTDVGLKVYGQDLDSYLRSSRRRTEKPAVQGLKVYQGPLCWIR
ncbi:MAG: hypothetical protein MZV63_44445 [Marinilabiliales bacterium]|nr:hypothetical protein [Marinilabiliales bacterium]